MPETGQTNEVQHVIHLPGALCRRNLLDHQPIPDVLIDGHVREQRIILKYGIHRPLIRREIRYVLPIEKDLTSGGPVKTCDHSQAGGLARTGRPQHGKELAIPDLKRDAIHGFHILEMAADVIK